MPLWLWLQSHYATLDLDPQSTAEEIRRAYKAKSFEHHPDRNPLRLESANWWFKQVCAANEVLSDPARRRAHDHGLATKLRERAAADAEAAKFQESMRAWNQRQQAAAMQWRPPTMGEALVGTAAQFAVLWAFHRFSK